VPVLVRVVEPVVAPMPVPGAAPLPCVVVDEFVEPEVLPVVVLWTIMAVWVWEVEPFEPPVCVVEPVVVPVLVPVVPFPVVVGTVQPTPPLGAGPVQFDGLPGTVLLGCVVEVVLVPEPVPVVEPVVVPLPCVVEEVLVELPVPDDVPIEPEPGDDGGIVEPLFVAPDPQTPFTYPVVQGTGLLGGPPPELAIERVECEVPPEALPALCVDWTLMLV